MKKLLLVIGFCLTISINSQAQELDTDIKFIASSSDFLDYYIKLSSIKKTEKYFGTYKFWVYLYPTEGKEKLCREVIYKDVKNVKYLSFGNQKILYFVKCDKEQIGSAASASYTIDNELIESNDISYPDYGTVIPDTISEALFDFVCNYVNSDNKNDGNLNNKSSIGIKLK